MRTLSAPAPTPQHNDAAQQTFLLPRERTRNERARQPTRRGARSSGAPTTRNRPDATRVPLIFQPEHVRDAGPLDSAIGLSIRDRFWGFATSPHALAVSARQPLPAIAE